MMRKRKVYKEEQGGKRKKINRREKQIKHKIKGRRMKKKGKQRDEKEE